MLLDELCEGVGKKKKTKKVMKDKSADRYPSFVAGNMLFTNVCSGDLAGTMKEHVGPLAKFNKMLFEADKPRPTQTKVGDEINLDDLFNTHHFHAPASSNKPKGVNIKQAGSQRTKQAVSGVKMDQRSADYMNQLDQSGLEDDRPMPNTPGTDRAARGRDLATTTRNTDVSTEGAEPNWHKIEDLPGYMKSAVRAIGRKVFAPMTNTDIEDIDIVANVNDSGPNDPEELRQIGAYLRRNGQRQAEAEMDFNQTVLQGYQADIQIWTAADREFLTVKDHTGHYIYSWPAQDSKNFNLFKDVKKGLGTERNRLR